MSIQQLNEHVDIDQPVDPPPDELDLSLSVSDTEIESINVIDDTPEEKKNYVEDVINVEQNVNNPKESAVSDTTEKFDQLITDISISNVTLEQVNTFEDNILNQIKKKVSFYTKPSEGVLIAEVTRKTALAIALNRTTIFNTSNATVTFSRLEDYKVVLTTDDARNNNSIETIRNNKLLANSIIDISSTQSKSTNKIIIFLTLASVTAVQNILKTRSIYAGAYFKVRKYAPIQLPKRCTNCGVPGHSKHQCWDEQKCLNCNQNGHTKQECTEAPFCQEYNEQGHRVGTIQCKVTRELWQNTGRKRKGLNYENNSNKQSQTEKASSTIPNNHHLPATQKKNAATINQPAPFSEIAKIQKKSTSNNNNNQKQQTQNDKNEHTQIHEKINYVMQRLHQVEQLQTQMEQVVISINNKEETQQQQIAQIFTCIEQQNQKFDKLMEYLIQNTTQNKNEQPKQAEATGPENSKPANKTNTIIELNPNIITIDINNENKNQHQSKINTNTQEQQNIKECNQTTISSTTKHEQLQILKPNSMNTSNVHFMSNGKTIMRSNLNLATKRKDTAPITEKDNTLNHKPIGKSPPQKKITRSSTKTTF